MANVVASEKECDFLAVSEPNITVCKFKGEHWYCGVNGDTLIVNFSKKYQVRDYRSENGFVCIETADTVLYSIYLSPNKCTLDDFKNHLNTLQNDIIEAQGRNKKIIITGDLNAKHPCWGGMQTNKKGEELLEWIHKLDLIILNDGILPTCVRPNGKSFIDLTIIRGHTTKESITWSVLEEESMSDHRFVLTQICKVRTERKPKYMYGETNLANFNTYFSSGVANAEVNYEQCGRALSFAYKKSTCRVKCQGDYKLPYWWNLNVEEKIKETRKKRRKFQKCKETKERDQLKVEYKVSKKVLKKVIAASKAKAWDVLCGGLESDIYGDAYKIVKRQMQISNPKTCLTLDQKWNTFKDLFITSRLEGIVSRESLEDTSFDDIVFSPDEIKGCGEKIIVKKAPGPDAIPPDIVKSAICNNVEYFTHLFNKLLKSGSFPDSWKIAKLVLIQKPKKCQNEQTKYRPICLINVIAKAYERLVNIRLAREIDCNGGLHKNQYGFRPGKTTVDAIEEVVRAAKEAQLKKLWNSLILVDVRNAFNTATWPLIINKLKSRNINKYLINVIVDYFTNRYIQLERNVTVEINGGVPQGSVLGPTLWNILYDDVMHIDVPQGVKLVCYADDLAISVTAKDAHEIVIKANETLHAVDLWMRQNKLEIAPEKTEAVVFNRRLNAHCIQFDCAGKIIAPTHNVTYLGVKLDWRLNFGPHLKSVCDKASRTAGALCKLLHNTKGPSDRKRRTLALANQSIILYAAPVWEIAMKFAIQKSRVLKAQRVLALRVCSAYKTVSTDAALVLANLTPIYLLALERSHLRKKKDSVCIEAAKKETLDRWQTEWDSSTKGRWTHRLIPNLEEWTRRQHGLLSFRLTQCLTGHGVFMDFLAGIGKRQDARCMYCSEAIDDARHTIFVCEKWKRERLVVQTKVGNITEENLVHKMLENDENWVVLQKYMENIIKEKEEEEKRRNNEN